MARSWDPEVTVIGGGLAGCEAAWQLAERGVRVALVEMKPAAMSPAHQTPLLCELVCSNSMRSDDPAVPAGLLKHELRRAGSLVIACADQHRVPAGSALAIERFGFGREVTVRLALHPNVRLERRLIDELPAGLVILATGPLTGGALARQLVELSGSDRLYFYDAIAPIVAADSIDLSRAYRASRWDKGTEASIRPAGEPRCLVPDPDVTSEEPDEAAVAEAEGDYINCPLTEAEYVAFVEAIRAGRKIDPHDFEEPRYFEGCLPIEVMAERGLDVLRHGPMRPVGLTEPRTGRWPYAVAQLRPENRWLSAYNMVGFQTRLAYPEQQRILSMIPALAGAEFLRFGSVHRNTYVDAPALLGPELELRERPEVQLAGLITGVEGYIESCAIGLLVAWFTAARLRDGRCPPPPPTTALGGLYHHVTMKRGPRQPYAPTNVNFGLFPPIEMARKRGNDKRERRRLMMARAIADFDGWIAARRSAA